MAKSSLISEFIVAAWHTKTYSQKLAQKWYRWKEFCLKSGSRSLPLKKLPSILWKSLQLSVFNFRSIQTDIALKVNSIENTFASTNKILNYRSINPYSTLASFLFSSPFNEAILYLCPWTSQITRQMLSQSLRLKSHHWLAKTDSRNSFSYGLKSSPTLQNI